MGHSHTPCHRPLAIHGTKPELQRSDMNLFMATYCTKSNRGSECRRWQERQILGKLIEVPPSKFTDTIIRTEKDRHAESKS